MAEMEPYSVKKTIGGVEYTAQFNGLRFAVRCMDECGAGEDANMEKFMQYVLDHVIVEPAGLGLDSFEDIDTLTEVVSFGREVMHGRFRKEKKRR